ncbi:MAG: hypothetical protein AAGC74_05955 [Verrucomicrobiota bacterium]
MDGLAVSKRREISAVQSLERAEPGSLGEFLQSQLRAEAMKKLQLVAKKKRRPTGFIAVGLAAVLLVLATLTGIWIWNPDASRVVAGRLFAPFEERLPWSPLQFVVSTTDSEVFYGGEVVMRVEITGGEIKEEVKCLVKRPSGKVSELGVYADGAEGRYARSLEQVVEPLEVAFSCGRARSAWMSVEPLLRPQVTGVKIEVHPPCYTKLRDSAFSLEGPEVKVLAGSEVRVLAESNRPLSGGTLVLRRGASEEGGTAKVIEELDGKKIEERVVAFSWMANRSGQVEAFLRDVQGIGSGEGLEFDLRVQADAMPMVDLYLPPPKMLATPRAKLKVEGEIEDDFGLAEVQLVRGLGGFSSRRETVVEEPSGREVVYETMIDLEKVGVRPGEVIELSLEAMDRNPSLLGLGTSSVAEVTIISEAEYAKRIRAKTTLQEFGERYRRLGEIVRRAREDLKELEEGLKNSERGRFEEAKKAVERTMMRLQDELQMLAEDFPAFEMENRLGEVAESLNEALGENLADLHLLDFEGNWHEMWDLMEQMGQRLGAPMRKAEKLREEAEIVKAFGRIAEMAAKFREIYERQKSLEERNKAIAQEVMRGVLRNSVQLKKLAEMQERLREEFLGFDEELRKRGEDLPFELVEVQEGVKQFLERMRGLGIAEAMEAASAGGRAGESLEAVRSATLARELLEQLLGAENRFSGMCRGESGQGHEEKDVAQTMQELLEGLLAQRGEGNGQAGGAGEDVGGFGADGAMASGFLMLDIPMLGPERMRFESDGPGEAGDGKTREQPAFEVLVDEETLRLEKAKENDGRNMSEAVVPEKYRKAVETYFSPVGAQIDK